MSKQNPGNEIRDAELQATGDAEGDMMKEKYRDEEKDPSAESDDVKSADISGMKEEQHCHNDIEEQVLSDEEENCPAKLLPEESNREDGEGEIHHQAAGLQSDLSSLEDEFQNTPPLDEDDDTNGIVPNTPEKKKLIRTTTNHSKGCPWNPSRKLFQHPTGRKPKKSYTKRQLKIKEFDCREIPTQGVWVQCDINHCNKWRFLKSETDPANIPHLWTCSMHPDEKFNSCDKPEEDYSQLEFIHNKFTEGSVVWAKMQGFPWWPAMVETDPDTSEFMCHDGIDTNVTHYHCVFLDKVVSRSWVHAASVKKFEEHGNPPEKLLYKKKHFYKQMLPARERALDALKLSIKERIHTYGFSKTFKGVWTKHVNDSPMEDLNDSEVSDGILCSILSSEDMKELLQKEGTEEAVKTMKETICDEMMYQLLDTGKEQNTQRGHKRKAGSEDEVNKKKSKKHKKHHHKSKHEKEKKEGAVKKQQKGTKKKKEKKMKRSPSESNKDNDSDDASKDRKMEEKGIGETETLEEIRQKIKEAEEKTVNKVPLGKDEVSDVNEVALGEDEVGDKRNIDSHSKDNEKDINEVMTGAERNEANRKDGKTRLDIAESTATKSDLWNDAKELECMGGDTSNDNTESIRSKGLSKAEREQKRQEKAAKKQQRLEENERKQREREMKRKQREEKLKEKDARKKAREIKKQQTEEQRAIMKQKRKQKEDKSSKTEDVKSQQKPPQRKPKFVAPKGKQTFVAPLQVTTDKESVSPESVTANPTNPTANPTNVALSNDTGHGPETDTKHEMVKLSSGNEDCKDVDKSDSMVIEKKKVVPAVASTKLKRKKFSVKRKISGESKEDVVGDLSTPSKGEAVINSCTHKKKTLTDRDGEATGKENGERRFVDEYDPVDEDILDLEWSDSVVPSQQFKNIIASPPPTGNDDDDDDSDPFEAVEE